MLSVAFKEWAVICRALAEGRQSVILRKGGIAEAGGAFRPEHAEYLLYPTYFHEHREGVKPDFVSLFDAAEAEKPEPGTVRFTHFARVTDVTHVTDLDAALALDALHAWTPEVVRKRFEYRTPGLFVLAVRVFRLGKGEPLADVLAGPQVAEGVYTSKSVHERVTRTGLDAPIMTGVYQVLHEGKPPLAAVQDLMTRRQKDETV